MGSVVFLSVPDTPPLCRWHNGFLRRRERLHHARVALSRHNGNGAAHKQNRTPRRHLLRPQRIPRWKQLQGGNLAKPHEAKLKM